MSVKHTPAPWGLQECPSGGMLLLRNLPDGRHPQSHLQIVPVSDAHLIAAAPDLLEALEDYISNGHSQNLLNRCKLIIAKAKGESHEK